MKLPTSKLGYTAAVLTVMVAILVPFFLTGYFSRVFANMGFHVDEMYSGGPKVRTIVVGEYSIDIHRQVDPHMLQRDKSFVQLDWKPVSKLPPTVSDLVDIDGDGRPDVRVNFAVPTDEKTPLSATVQSLNPAYESANRLAKEKLSSLIVRVDDAIVVRVPLARR